MSNQKLSTISEKLRDIFWPIKRSEMKLFVPMSIMMLCMLFNFGSLRSIKDSLVVPNIGAEAISFLKLWLVLPSTVIFTMLYVKLSNLFDYEKVFYLIISTFLGFFILFTYVLFPYQDWYHPSSETISHLISLYPNFKWFIYIFGKWSYALMYVFCELWSVVIINLLFWQYANNIFDTNAAKRFYPIIGMVGNVGLIMAGNVLVTFSDRSGVADINIADYVSEIDFQCRFVLKPIMHVIIFSGILVIFLYRYINNYVLKKPVITKVPLKSLKKTKTSLSLKDSVKLLMSSKYIGHIVLLVLCYGLVINLLEGPWKARVRELYPNTVDYLNFMGQFNIWMGISSVCFMVVGSNILRRFSWLTSALITPYMLTCTGLVFFGFVILGKDISYQEFNPIYFAVIIGAVQNILSKSTKYSLFDSTKEMAYIPLSLELRTKGKATVEVIGLKMGKSLGAFVQSFMFIIMPMATFDSVTVYLLGVFMIVSAIWILNIKALNKEYIKLQEAGNETH
ncbi:MAG: Npt1/Npt2 family nucleotide transporter [Rickettsiaceae bacterium]|nr:Npt1/Npt2 family nucleotide transporter [Rickettsiaceae bacterium]